MSDISIVGLKKADVLAALYNAAKAMGNGFIQYDPKPMTAEEAETLLEQMRRTQNEYYFDSYKGRVMKLELSSDRYFDSQLYDLFNGEGLAARIIDELRRSGDINPKSAQFVHIMNTLSAADDLTKH